MDASEIYPRRVNAKEVPIFQKGEEFLFSMADGTAQLSGREYEFRGPTLRRDQTAGCEVQGDPEEPQPTEPRDDVEAQNDFWSIQGDFIYRHHADARAQLYVPKGETFPIPLKYIDVTRSTHTNLDVMQEQRIDDCWNVDENRSLSDSWIGFTKFTLLKEGPPKGHMSSRERLIKNSDDNKTRSCVAGSRDNSQQAMQRKNEKNKNGQVRSRSSRTRAN